MTPGGDPVWSSMTLDNVLVLHSGLPGWQENALYRPE